MNLENAAYTATILSAVFAIIVIFYTGYQIKRNMLVNKGMFWLELEKMFAAHDEVHINLRPGGKWSENKKGPDSAMEWAKVENYMGLFEHCEVLISDRLIDFKTFKAIFSYRLYNIVSNKKIVAAKLINEKASWIKFINLLDKLKIKYL